MSAIYVQHAHNPSFFYGADRWVVGRRWARRFSHAQAALSFCAERDIHHAQVHVSFGPGAADVLIPVPPDITVAPSPPLETAGWEE
jgi:hypothetical protein